LEDIVSRIDAPLLDSININFFNQLIFDTPQLCRFINRMEGFATPCQANVVFEDNYVEVALHRPNEAENDIMLYDNRQHWQDDIENAQWLEVFRPFASVRDLVLHGELLRLVAPALKDLRGESVTEVLPALQGLFLEVPQPSEPVKKVIEKFIVSRQLSGCPIAVHQKDSWDEDYVCWEVVHP
jgi:hypothetical protein